MAIWLIIGLLISISLIWGWISDYKDKMKAKAVQDLEKEFNLTERVNAAKIILNKYSFRHNIYPQTVNDNLYEPDKTIGLCPKCRKGYLSIGKTFTGYDRQYHRYPTYSKYLRCSECGYRESYNNLQNRRSETKKSAAEQFKKDFQAAFSLR